MAAFAALFAVSLVSCGGNDEPENPDDPDVVDISKGEDTAYGIHFNKLYYLLDGTTATVAKADKNVTDVKVPSKVKRSGTVYNVTAIGDEAFLLCTSLANVSCHHQSKK